MAISEPGGSSDPTRGSGADKVTTAAPADPEAPPGALANEPAGSNEPDPAGGGCLKFGWGCLPAVAGMVAVVPSGLLYW